MNYTKPVWYKPWLSNGIFVWLIRSFSRQGSDPKNFHVWDSSCRLCAWNVHPKIIDCRYCWQYQHLHANSIEFMEFSGASTHNPALVPKQNLDTELHYQDGPRFNLFYYASSSHIKWSYAAIQNLFLTCMSGQSTARSTLLELTTSSAASWSPLQGLFFGSGATWCSPTPLDRRCLGVFMASPRAIRSKAKPSWNQAIYILHIHLHLTYIIVYAMWCV